MTLRTVGVRLTAEIGEYQSKLKAAGQSTRDFKGELDKAAKKGNLDTITNTAAGVGVALVGMAAYAVKSAADFDKAMSSVSAATHAPAAEMAQLRAAALQAGKDTMYSATQAAEGITELSKAGVSTADVLGGGLKGALSLAAAGQLSVGEAAETAASAMTQFKLKGSELPHVADLLAAAAGKAQGSVHDMGYALNQSGLVAAQFGLSIEDTTGALAEFASAGLTGSDAGTSLKTMLLALANPSMATMKQMSALGISFYDAQGKFVGLSGVAQILQTRLKDLSDQQRQQILGQIFGNDAIRAASILYTDGAKGVEKWKTAVNDSGYASKTAAELTNNLAGDIERLKGSLETMAIEAGSGGNSGLRLFVKTANALVNVLADLPSGVSVALTVLAGLSGVLLLGAAAWVKYRKVSADARAQLVAIGPAGEKAAAGMGRLTSVVGKAAGVFALWTAAMAAADGIMGGSAPNVEALTQGLDKFGHGAQLSGESARVLGGNLENLKTGFRFLADSDSTRAQWTQHLQKGLEAVIPGLSNTATSLKNTQTQIDAVDQSLAGLVTSGSAADAAATFNRLASVLAVGGVSMDEFKAKFPAYQAALEASGTTAKGTAGKLGDVNSALEVGADVQNQYKTKADSVAGALRGEGAAFISLSKQLRAATDPAFAFVSAQDAMTKAQKEATAAVKKHGATSVEARAANQRLVDAALDLQDAAGRASATLDGKLDPALVATLTQANVTKAQIKNVGKELGDAKKAADRYTGKYPAEISAPGAKQAKTDIDRAYTAANGFAGPYQARLSVDGQHAVNAALDELLVKQRALETGLSVSAARGAVQKDLDRNRQRGYAGGGYTGPGPKYKPAGVVHADEFVIRSDSRQKIESRAPGLLDKMNISGTVPGYARGGHVMQFRDNVSKTDIPPWSKVASKVAGDFGQWPSSPGAQRGDSGVWHKIVALVNASGIPHQFGNAYRPGDPLWHGSGRAVDFMGFNQDRLANFFLARQGQVLELIHRSDSHDYGITRGHYAPMPHQWPLHRNHLHVAMKNGGTITEPIFGVGASGRTYSFGENYAPERVTPMWQAGGHGGGGGGTEVHVHFSGPVGSRVELQNWLATTFDDLKRRGKV